MAVMIIKIPRVRFERGKENAEYKSGNEILELVRKKYKKFGTLALEEIHVDNSKQQEADKLIFQNSCEELEKNERVIFIGGDGTASKEIKRAYKKVFGSLEGFLSFDFNEEIKNIKTEKNLKCIEIFNIKKEEKAKIKKAVEIMGEFIGQY